MAEKITKKSSAADSLLAAAKAKRGTGPSKAEVLSDLEGRDAARADIIECPCCSQSTRAANIPEDPQTVRALVDRFLRNRDRDAVEALRPATAAAMRQRLQRPRSGE